MSVIALASDHAGVDLKSFLAEELKSRGIEVLDLGTNGTASVDYPDFGYAMGKAIADGKVERGVAICGSGIGISIALNRFPEVRAALCHDGLTARLSRQHNDANVLVLGGRIVGLEVARDCLAAFLDTPYEGGRHARRVAKLGEPPLDATC
ncbi:MAG: ribose 5-phosphate isomerase B [Zavarzinia sp.]|nr:ribose 5-phosphate isomerase B [Zavarzinia sp.]